jgi:4a-hydroxytetrahydrobiopterin dehydratase
MKKLKDQNCTPPKENQKPLDAGKALAYLAGLQNEWKIDPETHCLTKEYRFENYYQTMAFVNAVAWIAHKQDHHPDLEVSYNRCTVNYTTHQVGGLSENDFICAAKIDNLL